MRAQVRDIRTPNWPPSFPESSTTPVSSVPPEDQEERRNREVVDTAEAVVEGTLEAVDLTTNVASCGVDLPSCDVLPDCAVIDCAPGCV